MSQTLSAHACAFQCGQQLKQLEIECEWITRDWEKPLRDANSLIFQDLDIGSPFTPVSMNSVAAHEVERRRTRLEQLALKACSMLQDLKMDGESNVDEHAPILKSIEASISRWRKLERVRFKDKSLTQIMRAAKNTVPVNNANELFFEDDDCEKIPEFAIDSYQSWQKAQLYEIEYCRKSTVEALKALEQFCAVKIEKLPQPIRDLILLGEQFQNLEQEAYLEDEDCPDFKEKLRKTIRFLLAPIPSLQSTKICQELAGGSCLEILGKANCLIAQSLEIQEGPKKPATGAGDDYPKLDIPKFDKAKSKSFDKQLKAAAQKQIKLRGIQIDFGKKLQLKKLLLLLLNANANAVSVNLFEDYLYRTQAKKKSQNSSKLTNAFRKAITELNALLKKQMNGQALKASSCGNLNYQITESDQAAAS